MRFKRIISMFKNGNVSVCGLRGTGKDLIFGNVIARRNKSYVSNLDYSKNSNYVKLILKDLDIGNKYYNFIENKIIPYDYKYPIGADIYISDAGIFLPSQYCNQLNRDYEGVVSYQALSRQISHNNVHYNAQNLNRVWDKVREQSDIYIRCRKCFYLFGLVIQFITIYDKFESCLNRVNPCRVRVPLFNKQAKVQAQLYLDNFYNQHGSIRNHVLIYFNKSKHDTYHFGKVLKGD